MPSTTVTYNNAVNVHSFMFLKNANSIIVIWSLWLQKGLVSYNADLADSAVRLTPRLPLKTVSDSPN